MDFNKWYAGEGPSDKEKRAKQPEKRNPREVYAEADEATQMKMDLEWLNFGGHLSVEKMDRLVEAGLIPAWR